MAPHVGALAHAVKRLPLPYIAARGLRRLGVELQWLRRIEFLHANDARNPGRVPRILANAMRQAGLAPERLVSAARAGTTIEVGCGRHIPFAAFAFAAGGPGYIGVDPSLEPDLLDHPRVRRAYLEPALAAGRMQIHDLAAVPSGDGDGAADRLLSGSQLVRGGIEQGGLGVGDAGLCVSVSCLEHISEIERAAEAMASVSGSETVHVHLVNFANHLSKEKPFTPLYDAPFEAFSARWGPIVNGLRLPDLEAVFADAGLALKGLPLDRRPAAIPEDLDASWRDAYSRETLAIRTALLTNLTPEGADGLQT